jgi:plasmid stability protein
MKNITVSVDDETHRRARIKAAESETSLSALVKQFLVALAANETGPRQLADEEKALRERIRAFSAAERLPRDKVHERP